MGLPTTWAALLAHFTGIAQRAVALPRTEDGERLRASVPHVIGLQAVAFALAEVDGLPADERAAGLDRAEVAIKEHASAVHAAYRGVEMPGMLRRCVEDARRALREAQGAGLAWVVTGEELVTEHPAELVGLLLEAGFGGDLMVPAPGFVLFEGSPCGFVRAAAGGAPWQPVADELLAAIGVFLGQRERLSRGPVRGRAMQVYRQYDFGLGRAVRDVVAPVSDEPRAGQALLVAAIVGGEAQPVALAPRHRVPVERVPVVFEGTEETEREET
ncbi:MAG: hypothetical protein KDA05_08770 [Phycisphaerales bacterium]|nr:hypothetical protein [Phycisphaerales bacterium]MCB9841403.1 hypothetical protein [Phycisphaeraceae bacterium]